MRTSAALGYEYHPCGRETSLLLWFLFCGAGDGDRTCDLAKELFWRFLMR
jgi:hypothetical protein